MIKAGKAAGFGENLVFGILLHFFNVRRTAGIQPGIVRRYMTAVLIDADNACHLTAKGNRCDRFRIDVGIPDTGLHRIAD